MESSLIDFGVIEVKRPGATEKKNRSENSGAVRKVLKNHKLQEHEM